MSSQADFIEGKVLFEEVPQKPPDLRRYQGAMFIDRPDLWPTPRRHRNGKPVPPEQQPLIEKPKPAIAPPFDLHVCKQCGWVGTYEALYLGEIGTYGYAQDPKCPRCHT
jgi:hypothetical protein